MLPSPSDLRAQLAECLGTATLLFLGTGAVVVDAQLGGAFGPAGIAAAFGLVVMVLIYAIGDVSGAHINPAVTIAFALARRFAWRRVPGFILAQCLGGLLGSLAVRWLVGAEADLGATRPAMVPASIPLPDWLRAAGLEVVFSAILMAVILGIATRAKEKGLIAGLAVGATIALLALVGGPLTGASMNPARSLAPALVSGELGHLGLYIVAPVVGTSLATGLQFFLQPNDCCPDNTNDCPTSC